MADFKSKLPDFQEVIHITGKFFKDIKTSICEIAHEYKQKREEENIATTDDVTSSLPPEATVDNDSKKDESL